MDSEMSDPDNVYNQLLGVLNEFENYPLGLMDDGPIFSEESDDAHAGQPAPLSNAECENSQTGQSGPNGNAEYVNSQTGQSSSNSNAESVNFQSGPKSNAECENS